MLVPESTPACPRNKSDLQIFAELTIEKALAVRHTRDKLKQMQILVEPSESNAGGPHRAQATNTVKRVLHDAVEKELQHNLIRVAVAQKHIEAVHAKAETPRRNLGAALRRSRGKMIFGMNVSPEQARLEGSGEEAASSVALIPNSPSDWADAGCAPGAAAVPQKSIKGVQAVDNYERLLQHLRQVEPILVGIRFELLMDGAPEQLRGQSESQLHVVVVRQVAWPARHYIACLRLVALLSFMLFILSYLFGPVTGFIALYLLNSEHFVREFAGLVVGVSQRHDDQHLPSFVLLSFFCLAILPLSRYFFDENWLMQIIIWFLEKLFGLMLIALAYSCVVHNDFFDKRRFHQARSTIVMLAFHLIASLSLHPLAIDSWTWSLIKVAALAALTWWVYSQPARFYYLCFFFFEIPELFVFNALDITRVLQLRHDIRARAETIQRLGIAHVQRGHVDNICVGHVTTERWGSILVHPAVYNSPAWRRLLYLSYTYFFPILNILYFFVHPTEPVARTLANIRHSFNNDFVVSVLILLRSCIASLLGILGWGLGLFLSDWFSSMHTFVEWCFKYLAQVSQGIAAMDQWISYFMSRFAPLKSLFGMMVRPVQALVSLFFGIIGSFGQLLAKILPHITVARIVPNGAANADVVGRWFLSGWIHNMWQRWNHQHTSPTESRSNSRYHGEQSATVGLASSSSQTGRDVGQSSSQAHNDLKKRE